LSAIIARQAAAPNLKSDLMNVGRCSFVKEIQQSAASEILWKEEQSLGRFYQPDIFAEIGDTKRPCLAFG
jgi:hypothetical protein